MHKRTRIHAFTMVSCLALGLGAQEPAPAPQAPDVPAAGEKVKIAEHESRWDYPKEVTTTAGHAIHSVAKGDTLWDLAGKYLGNPFAWPQIWELNKWVKDPHWIFPGDPLTVEAARAVVPAGQEAEWTPYEVAALKPDLRRIPKTYLEEYAYTLQDFIQLPFLAPRGAEAYFKMSGAFLLSGHQDKSRGILSDGDFVYFGGGSNNGLKAGDRLVITKVQTRNFYHPDDTTHRRPMGDVLQQQGIIRVTKIYPDTSVAVIEHSLDGIYEPAYAIPYPEPATLVADLRKEPAGPVDLKEPLGKIIYLREDRPVAAMGDMVLIDQGTRQGLKVGDVLLTARRRPMEAPALASAPSKTASHMTNYYIGQMVVVRTEEGTATCRILRTKEELIVGDLVTR